jgi:hypothetical protein
MFSIIGKIVRVGEAVVFSDFIKTLSQRISESDCIITFLNKEKSRWSWSKERMHQMHADEIVISSKKIALWRYCIKNTTFNSIHLYMYTFPVCDEAL